MKVSAPDAKKIDQSLKFDASCYGHRATGAGAAEQLQVRKLEDNYFSDWPAGTELGRESFKQLMRIELRRLELRAFTLCPPNHLSHILELGLLLPMNVNRIELLPWGFTFFTAVCRFLQPPILYSHLLGL
jgi:hypothetical protein